MLKSADYAEYYPSKEEVEALVEHLGLDRESREVFMLAARSRRPLRELVRAARARARFAFDTNRKVQAEFRGDREAFEAFLEAALSGQIGFGASRMRQELRLMAQEG